MEVVEEKINDKLAENDKRMAGSKMNKECKLSDCASCKLRSGFKLVKWKEQEVYNVKGSSRDKRNGSTAWINLWKKMFVRTLGFNPSESCQIAKPIDENNPEHKKKMQLRGGHLEKKKKMISGICYHCAPSITQQKNLTELQLNA